MHIFNMPQLPVFENKSLEPKTEGFGARMCHKRNLLTITLSETEISVFDPHTFLQKTTRQTRHVTYLILIYFSPKEEIKTRSYWKIIVTFLLPQHHTLNFTVKVSTKFRCYILMRL